MVIMCGFVSAEDPKLAEFLQLMRPRHAGAIWSNEDAMLAAAASQKPSTAANVDSAAAATGASVHRRDAAVKESVSHARKSPSKDAAAETGEEPLSLLRT